MSQVMHARSHLNDRCLCRLAWQAAFACDLHIHLHDAKVTLQRRQMKNHTAFEQRRRLVLNLVPRTQLGQSLS